MTVFYVYVDWTKEETSRPFYVGIGTSDRVRFLKRNPIHSNIAKKHGMNREVVFASSLRDLVSGTEVELIREHKTHHGFEGNWGANLTSGGDGGIFNPSPDVLRRMSESRRKRITTEETRQKLSASGKNRVFSEDHRRKLSEKAKGRKMSEAQKEKLRNIRLGTKLSLEHRALLSEVHKGKRPSEETKQKISEGLRKSWEARNQNDE